MLARRFFPHTRLLQLTPWLLGFIVTACASVEVPKLESASLGTTYFVSSSGNDAHSGTSRAQAWQTIAKVNAQDFAPGDRILFGADEQFEGNLFFDAADAGTTLSPVVVGSYGRGRATIQAGDGSGIFVFNAAGFRIRDLNIVGSGVETNTGQGILFFADLPGAVKYAFIRISRVEVSGFLEGGILIGADNGESYTGYRDVRITRAKSHSNGDSGIQIFGRFVLNTDATEYANENVYIGYSEVYNNRGKPNKGNNSGNGIVIGGVDGAVIERSLAYNNGEANDFEDGGPVGIWAYDSNDVTVQYNEAYNNKTGTGKDGGGFDLDGGVSNSVMQYNYSHDNEGAGFLLAQFEGARPFTNNTVRYNVSENDGRKNSYAGIYLFAAPGFDIEATRIYHNTVFVSPAPSGTPSAFGVLDFGGFYDDVQIGNNLFVATSGLPLIVNPDENGLLFSGNAYDTAGGPFVINWNDVTYRSLAAWRSATGQERLGGADTGLTSDSRLRAAGQGGTIGNPRQLGRLSAYKLRRSSPLIDAGLDLRSLLGWDVGRQDFYGRQLPQGHAFDIGAFEAATRD